jgi:hypothetical protein
MLFCNNCLSDVEDNASSCSSCGYRQIVDIGQAPLAPAEVSQNAKFRRRVSFFSSPTQKNGDLASRGLRFLELVLDFVLAGLTFGVGWFIAFLILCRRGQTPAKFLLRMRLVTENVGTPRASVTFWRYYIPNLLTWLLAPFGILGFLSLPFAFAWTLALLQFLAAVIPLVDAIFIFGRARKRAVDYMFKTQVVHI